MSAEAAAGRQFAGDFGCAVLSAACVAHCIFSPILASAPAILGVQLGEEGPAHLMIATTLIASSFLVIWFSYLRHRVLWPAAVASAGLILIGLSLLYGEALGESNERLVTVVGGALLVAGHFFNFRCARRNRIATAIGIGPDSAGDCGCEVCQEDGTTGFRNRELDGGSR